MSSSLNHSHSLSLLRQLCEKQRILICFNGPFSRALIAEIGLALRRHITDCHASDGGHPRDSGHASHGAAMDVFAVYIEMSQNIQYYCESQGYTEADAAATLVIAESPGNGYCVSAGNIVEMADGLDLVQRIQSLACLDQQQLKQLYKGQLRQPRPDGVRTGAGLGLIDVARKSIAPLECDLEKLDGSRGFFTLRALIGFPL